MIIPVYTQITCIPTQYLLVPDGVGDVCPLADGTFTADGIIGAC